MTGEGFTYILRTSTIIVGKFTQKLIRKLIIVIQLV